MAEVGRRGGQLFCSALKVLFSFVSGESEKCCRSGLSFVCFSWDRIPGVCVGKIPVSKSLGSGVKILE